VQNPQHGSDNEEEDELKKELPGPNPAEKWSNYNHIEPKKHSELTKHHYFLLPREISGFALKEKQWCRLL